MEKRTETLVSLCGTFKNAANICDPSWWEPDADIYRHAADTNPAQSVGVSCAPGGTKLTDREPLQLNGAASLPVVDPQTSQSAGSTGNQAVPENTARREQRRRLNGNRLNQVPSLFRDSLQQEKNAPVSTRPIRRLLPISLRFKWKKRNYDSISVKETVWFFYSNSNI